MNLRSSLSIRMSGWPALRLASLILMLLLSTGCVPILSNFRPQVQTRSLNTPIGIYQSMVWLQPDQFAFLYTPSPTEAGKSYDTLNGWDYQIYLYQPSKNDWHALKVDKPAECFSGWIQLLEPLPDQRLAFLYQCNPTIATVKYSIQAWDVELKNYRVIQAYPEHFFARSFSFAPDMTSLMQEEYDDSIQDKVWRVDRKGSMEQVLNQYARAHSPAWSPQKPLVALVANEKIPKADSNPLTALVGIGDVVFYPWDIYLMGPDGSNIRKIFEGVKVADWMTWSPDGRRLALWGEYQGSEGIWVLDINNLKMTRVWSRIDYYSWSPDGKQMVVLEQLSATSKESRPVIIDLPN